MSPMQEILNAITMVFPTLLIGWNVWKGKCKNNVPMMVLFIGSAIHFPVAFTYHMNVALNKYKHRIDNHGRRLDQTVQLMVGTAYSYALSKSLMYTAFSGIVNSYGIWKIWNPKTSNDGKRWMTIMKSVILYTAPILWHGKINQYMLAIGSFLVGGLCFIPQFNYVILKGYGHSLFHLILTYYAHILVEVLQGDCRVIAG